jgi:glycosyltransferase involved in cell wall biosynthesis
MTTPFTEVHQFHSGTARGDAITSQMLFLRDRLRSLGFASEVFAEHIPEDLLGLIKPVADWSAGGRALLLVHHSMGHTAFETVINLDVPMVTVFHSITPARFFDDAFLREHIKLGFSQLRSLASRTLFGIADSNHNRQQMYDAGFSSVSVLPVKSDYSVERALRVPTDPARNDWLFVGRVVPNKRAHEIVRAFGAYVRGFQSSAHLHLVGDMSFTPYVDVVKAEIEAGGLASRVTLHGKLSDTDMHNRYRDSGLFVSLSEHEGFGVPLLEAMAFGLPVIARDAAAVSETLGGAGALVDVADPVTIAALAHVIHNDGALRQRLIAHQDARLARLERFDIDAFLMATVRSADGQHRRPTVQIQGPFETSYSLAILNRELALALDRQSESDVSIYATEGPGDYKPALSDLDLHPKATELWRKAPAVGYPDVVIRQMYPPRVHDSTGGLTLQYFGWEESRLPPEYVEDFNRYLDGIGTMSSFVSDVLAESGVVVPTMVVGVGVHQPDASATIDASELRALRSTRILHISSAFPRKGVDVLLEAFVEAFAADDDVTLILKTFPNPHNRVGEVLERLRADGQRLPDIRWIDRDLDRSSIDALYGLATAYVHPARGEGFGLPVAEAMLAGVPVISVAATGLADFVSESTAAVIGHSSATAVTHLSVPGSTWVEPDRGDLVRELKSVALDADRELRARRVVEARRLISAEYSWDRVAERWQTFINTRRERRQGLEVAAVTTFNSRCGIAEYSASLHHALGSQVETEIYADHDVEPVDPQIEKSVTRVWWNHLQHNADGLIHALERSHADLVHIQYNFGFLTLAELGRVIRHEAPRRPIVVTLHRTADLDTEDGPVTVEQIAEELRLADAVIVHQDHDVERLAIAGVSRNVHCIPIGSARPMHVDRQAARTRFGVSRWAFVVGTFGFLLPHKGTLKLIQAIGRLRALGINAELLAVCARHPDPSSAHYLRQCEDEIRHLGLDSAVHLITDYLEQDEALAMLAAADVVALPYEATRESSSAALRFVLPLGRPIVTSNVPIFEDAADAVLRVKTPVDSQDLSDFLERLWLNEELRATLTATAREYTTHTSWTMVGKLTMDLYDRVMATCPRQRSEPHVHR